MDAVFEWMQKNGPTKSRFRQNRLLFLAADHAIDDAGESGAGYLADNR